MREVGVDIIEIARIAQAAQNRRFLERVFTPAELERCLSRKQPWEELAGRWAAKEAVVKCLGQRVNWKDIEILNEPSGKPYVQLYGRAQELANGRRVIISISHCKEYAVATALLEPSPDQEVFG